MINIKIGDKISCKNKLGYTYFYELVKISKGINKYYTLKAIDETLEQMKVALVEMKEKNEHYQGIKNTRLDDFALMEVEEEWFNQREITLLN